MDIDLIIKMYVGDKKSLPEISEETGFSKSGIRYHLKKNNCLRSRSEGIKCSRHKLGKHLIGKTYDMKEETKSKISIAKLSHSEKHAKGYRINSSGYYELTKGSNKGRLLHIVIAENLKGRALNKNEVVHHIDENKTNNNPSNLMVMTRSDHQRHHATKLYKDRKINEKGQFI